jgi:hypothetical protein
MRGNSDFMPLTPERAEVVGLKALGWLAANDDLLPSFLNASGASISEVRDRASDPSFLGAVLDFLMMDDAWVMGFCQAQGLGFDQPMRARAGLPGGEAVHWT